MYVATINELDQAIDQLAKNESQIIDIKALPLINEEEIKKMILNEEERAFKERVWKNINKEWIAD